jgi:D-tyrosyl-tRNA(Tyr) deacylase
LDTTNKRLDVATKQLALIVSRHQAHDKHAANQLSQALESQRAAEKALADRDAHVATRMEQAEEAERKCEDMKIQVRVCEHGFICPCTHIQ